MQCSAVPEVLRVILSWGIECGVSEAPRNAPAPSPRGSGQCRRRLRFLASSASLGAHCRRSRRTATADGHVHGYRAHRVGECREEGGRGGKRLGHRQTNKHTHAQERARNQAGADFLPLGCFTVLHVSGPPFPPPPLPLPDGTRRLTTCLWTRHRRRASSWRR